MDPLFDFSGKVVLITGATRGLGYRMARAFAERGADLVVASRRQEACDTVRDVALQLGGSVMGVIESPIKGAEGNTEFLMYVECPTRSVSCES